MRASELKHLYAVTLILLMASAMGGVSLNADVIWGDELSSVAHMGAFNPPHSPQQVLQSIRAHAPDHVPLYYLLGAGWSRFAGWTQFALRYLSLLAGIMMLAFFYKYTRYTVDKRTALVAVFLLATNAFTLFYFHELRGYTLLLLLIAVHSCLYWRLMRPARYGWLIWFLFSASGTAMLYTHVLGLIMLAGLGMTHLLLAGRSNRSNKVLIGWAIGIGLFLPYLMTMYSDALTWGETKNATSAILLVEPLLALLANGLVVLMLPLTLMLAYQLSRNPHRFVLGQILLSAILVAILAIVSWAFDLIAVNRMRYFLVIWFPAVILISYSLTAFTRSDSVIVIFAGIWLVAGVLFGQSGLIQEYATFGKRTWQFPPLHLYVQELHEKVRPNDFLVGFSESLTINENRSNYEWGISDYYLDAQLDIDGRFLHTNLKRYRLEEDVTAILNYHAQILLAHDPSKAPLNYAKTLSTVQSKLTPCDLLVDEPTLMVRRYTHPVMGCEHEAAPIEYENGIRLIDRAAIYDADAELVQVLTWWHVPEETMLDEYNISLQIISSDGKNLRQNDRHLYDKIVPWSIHDLSTAGLPDEDLSLVLILYRRDSGSKVNGVDQSTAVSGKILPLIGLTLSLDASK